MGDIRSTTDALKKDMEKLKKNLQTDKAAKLEDQIQRMRNLLPSLETHFKVKRDRRGSSLSMQHSRNQAIRPGGPEQALKTLKTLIGDPKSLDPIVKMLEDMVKALETLK